MMKISAVWSGWAGAPGYSNFYWTGDTALANLDGPVGAIRSFFAGITLCLPTPVSITVSPVVQVIDPETGELQSEMTAPTTPAVVAGAGGTTFASPVGACVVWRSAATIAGHVVKGKTFIVPMTSAGYDTDGTLLASRLTEIRTAATTLKSYLATGGASLGVWHRPVAHAGGQVAAVLVATVNDKAAVLKSRRA